jgi:uncharacterized protein
MELQQHDLAHEFPEYKDAIHALKTSNAHFSKLFDEYHVVNREVIRIEQNIEPVTDEYAENKKKQRLLLKDQLYALLAQAAQ